MANEKIPARDEKIALFQNKVPKSKRRIGETFLEMRKCTALENISVVSLCERADVNKSTFYHYFHDIYDLSDQMQLALISRIVSNFEHVENIIKDPGEFVKDVLTDCRPDSELISILFSGNQKGELPEKLEAVLRDLLAEIIPDQIADMDVNLHLSYQLYGAYYAFMNNPQFEKDDKISYIAKLADRVQIH